MILNFITFKSYILYNNRKALRGEFMKNISKASEELFFDILIISLVSFIYFKCIFISELTLLLGLIFSFIYFGVNFYIGYKYKLKIINSLIVGIIGSGMGIFFIFFSLYAEFILEMPNFANWIAIPYFIPTMSIIKLFSININYLYAPILMIINIILVVIGSITQNIMNKLYL